METLRKPLEDKRGIVPGTEMGRKSAERQDVQETAGNGVETTRDHADCPLFDSGIDPESRGNAQECLVAIFAGFTLVALATCISDSSARTH